MGSEKIKTELTKPDVIDEYDHSSLATNDPYNKSFVESWNNRMIGGDILDELIAKPFKAVKESDFIKYVVGYYKNPTDENRLALFNLIKSPLVDIRVLDDNNFEKILFVMPPMFHTIEARPKLKDHNSIPSIEQLVLDAKNIRERAGAMGDIYFAKKARNYDVKIIDDGSNMEIAKILHKYGVTLPGFNLDSSENEKTEQSVSINHNEDSGYSDEW